MQISLTDKFYDDKSIIVVAKKPKFVFTWSSIAKQALQQGEGMANIIKIRRKIEIQDSFSDDAAFRTMVEQGMVQTTDSVGKLPSEKFEEWWKLYPARISNGKKVKIGKAKTKKLFDNLITSELDYQQLIQSTKKYSSICGKFSRDPERFLRADFWKEYLSVESNTTKQFDNSVDNSYLDEMLQK